jgi:hypothetical protein
MPLFDNIRNWLGPGVLISARTVTTQRVQVSVDIAH